MSGSSSTMSAKAFWPGTCPTDGSVWTGTLVSHILYMDFCLFFSYGSNVTCTKPELIFLLFCFKVSLKALCSPFQESPSEEYYSLSQPSNLNFEGMFSISFYSLEGGTGTIQPVQELPVKMLRIQWVSPKLKEIRLNKAKQTGMLPG